VVWISQRCALDVDVRSARVRGSARCSHERKGGASPPSRVGGPASCVKGPPILLFYLLALVARAWAERDWRSLLRVPWLRGLLAFLAVVALWGVPWAARLGLDEVEAILFRQTAGRMSKSVRARPELALLTCARSRPLPAVDARVAAARVARVEAPRHDDDSVNESGASAGSVSSSPGRPRSSSSSPRSAASGPSTCCRSSRLRAAHGGGLARLAPAGRDLIGGTRRLAAIAAIVYLRRRLRLAAARRSRLHAAVPLSLAAASPRNLGVRVRRELDAGRTVVLLTLPHRRRACSTTATRAISRTLDPPKSGAIPADHPRRRGCASSRPAVGEQLVFVAEADEAHATSRSCRGRGQARRARLGRSGLLALEGALMVAACLLALSACARRPGRGRRQRRPPRARSGASCGPAPTRSASPRPSSSTPPAPFQMKFADGTTYAPQQPGRPIVVNLWYPAADAARGGEAMRTATTSTCWSTTPTRRSRPFAAALVAYDRDVVARELFDAGLDQLDEAARAQLDALLDTPTACLREAAPRRERFPLLVYHSGYGSSVRRRHGALRVPRELRLRRGRQRVPAGRRGRLQRRRPRGDGTRRRLPDRAALAARRRRRGAGRDDRPQRRRPRRAAAARARSQPAGAPSSASTPRRTTTATPTPRWQRPHAAAARPRRPHVVPLLFCAQAHANFDLADHLVAADRWLLHREPRPRGVDLGRASGRRSSPRGARPPTCSRPPTRSASAPTTRRSRASSATSSRRSSRGA
jgi:hypothetical protein